MLIIPNENRKLLTSSMVRILAAKPHLVDIERLIPYLNV